MEKEIIDYIYGTDFLDDMKVYVSENPFLYNKLISIHCLVVFSKTTGLKDGGFNLSYFKEMIGDDGDMWKPNFQYHCYTTKDRLIEDTNSCSNSIGVFKNKFFEARNTRKLREEINNYSKKLLLEIEETKEVFKLLLTDNTTLKVKHLVFKSKDIIEFYNKILEDREVCSVIENIFFNKMLKKEFKEEKTKVKKI